MMTNERETVNILFWMFVDAPVHLSTIKSHVSTSSDEHTWLTEHLWREQITHTHHLHSRSLARTHSSLMCSSLACYWLWKQTLLHDWSAVPWGSRTTAQTGWKRLLVSCNCYLIMVLKAPQIFRHLDCLISKPEKRFRQALWTAFCCRVYRVHTFSLCVCVCV